MRTVSIVGAGRVGGALALSLPRDKYRVENLVINENSPADEVVSALEPTTSVTRLDNIESISSDIVLVTTQDGCIREAATAVGLKIKHAATIFHTSGACDSSSRRERPCADASWTSRAHPSEAQRSRRTRHAR